MRLSQVNVRQNMFVTSRNFKFTKLAMTGKNLEIISQIVLWYENSFRKDLAHEEKVIKEMRAQVTVDTER